jgi:hypothetical protein
MTMKQQSVSDTINWLSFPRQAYPNFYLNVERLRQRFRGYLGSISQFSKSIDKSAGANATVKALFVEAGIQGSHGDASEIQWDVTDPLAQALILRAYLATAGELHSDARSAPVTDFVLVRGPGGLVLPFDDTRSVLENEKGISPDVAAEIAAEQEWQATIGITGTDPKHRYWPAYANTDGGLVVSLLGQNSLIQTEVRSYIGVDLTYCMFGQKIRDWNSWTLLAPLHVWVEPPGKANWG